MLVHRPFGPIGIACGHGVEDRPVRLVGDLVAAGPQRGLALLQQPLDQPFMDGDEDRIARDHRQDIVEADIGLLEALEVADRLPVGGERGFEIRQVLLGGMRRGIAGKAGFEEAARALEILHPARCGEHVPGRAGQGADHELRRRLRHPRPLPRPELHQPHLPQMEQRLADGGATDPELPHQVAFGWQEVRRRVGAVLDHALQMLRHVLVQLAAPDRHRSHLVYL